jgi:ABC-type nitrate/sulfonate/bicarbonate transport system substrate-binding protein
MKNSITIKMGTIVLMILVAVGLVLFMLLNKTSDNTQPLRLGWQPPWINQGQIVEVLKNSDILKKNEVQVNFIPFTYGGPMTEAALAGSLDILFVGDQPAITLISKDSNWEIVARMTDYRSAIIVPYNSPYKTIADLKGKRIATAFGSTTHRDLIRELLSAGLDPKKDVELVNLDQAEHASLISAGGPSKWSGVDAIATYDPTIAISILKGDAKILQEWTSPSVVIAKKDIIERREKDIVQFLKSYVEAYPEYSSNSSKYNNIYAKESRLDLPDSIYSDMAKIEPNMMANNAKAVDVQIDATRQLILQKNANIAFSIGIIKKNLILENYFNESLLNKINLQ